MRSSTALPLLLIVPLLMSARPASSACAPAAACRCGEARHFDLMPEAFVAMQRDRADWVAAARVTGVDTLDTVLIPGQRDSLSTRPIVARLAVTRTWKGEARDSQTVLLTTTNLRTTCDLTFVPGDSYVVFASRTEDGQLQPRRCGGTVSLRDAASTLAVLGTGDAPRLRTTGKP